MNTHRVRADGVRITHDPFAPGKNDFFSRFRTFPLPFSQFLNSKHRYGGEIRITR